MHKAYDWEELEGELKERGIDFVGAPRSNRKVKRDYDKHICKEWNLVERFFAFLNSFAVSLLDMIGHELLIQHLLPSSVLLIGLSNKYCSLMCLNRL